MVATFPRTRGGSGVRAWPLLGGLLLCAPLMGAPLTAGEPVSGEPAPPPAGEGVTGTISPDSSRTADPFSAPVALEALDGLRGGDSVENHNRVTGEVGGNTAERVTTGATMLGGGAFAGASGITTVIQNTGANVLIQNGMVVNVQFVAPRP